ncbi:hypothetical protein [Eubacterium xylanophilum]|uniref:hypothetical protein n=1 Tax=Eubacterium xylanophilum TaxID=39497 RepID=UPI00047A21A6|nr:hypothetical protein [Eubacterium xylanophilum]
MIYLILLCITMLVPQVAGADVGLKGKGTYEEPYQISNAEELIKFRDIVNNSKKNSICDICAELTDDIVLNDVNVTSIDDNIDPTFQTSSGAKVNRNDLKKWEPIGWSKGDQFVFYGGVFKGNNHTIRGVYVDDKDMSQVGLFGATCNAEIYNLDVADSFIRGKDYVGGIAGFSYDSLFFNCWFDNSDKYQYSSFVIGKKYVGGITGVVYDQYGETKGFFKKNGVPFIQHCVNCGTIAGDKFTGGVCGLMYYGATKGVQNFGYIYCEHQETTGEVSGFNVQTAKQEKRFGEIEQEDIRENAEEKQTEEVKDNEKADDKKEVSEKKSDIKENSSDKSEVDEDKLQDRRDDQNSDFEEKISGESESNQDAKVGLSENKETKNEGKNMTGTIAVPPKNQKQLTILIVIGGLVCIAIVAGVFIVKKRKTGEGSDE